VYILVGEPCTKMGMHTLIVVGTNFAGCPDLSSSLCCLKKVTKLFGNIIAMMGAIQQVIKT
jgi:hypothetical protein